LVDDVDVDAVPGKGVVSHDQIQEYSQNMAKALLMRHNSAGRRH
jgi:hypothetical protein